MQFQIHQKFFKNALMKCLDISPTYFNVARQFDKKFKCQQIPDTTNATKNLLNVATCIHILIVSISWRE